MGEYKMLVDTAEDNGQYCNYAVLVHADRHSAEIEIFCHVDISNNSKKPTNWDGVRTRYKEVRREKIQKNSKLCLQTELCRLISFTKNEALIEISAKRKNKEIERVFTKLGFK